VATAPHTIKLDCTGWEGIVRDLRSTRRRPGGSGWLSIFTEVVG